MKIYCSKCGQEYDVPDEYLGKNVECQKCDNKFLVEKKLSETQFTLKQPSGSGNKPSSNELPRDSAHEASRSSKKPSKTQPILKRPSKKTLLTMLLIIVVVVIASGSWFGYKIYEKNREENYKSAILEGEKYYLANKFKKAITSFTSALDYKKTDYALKALDKAKYKLNEETAKLKEEARKQAAKLKEEARKQAAKLEEQARKLKYKQEYQRHIVLGNKEYRSHNWKAAQTAYQMALSVPGYSGSSGVSKALGVIRKKIAEENNNLKRSKASKDSDRKKLIANLKYYKEQLELTPSTNKSEIKRWNKAIAKVAKQLRGL